MKIILTFEAQEEIVTLPLHHNHFIQAAIYQLLDPIYANFLHQEGYTYKDRQFRLFSFSRLMGKYSVEPKEGIITFAGPIKLIILTPLQHLSKDIVNSLIMGKEFRIGSKILKCNAVELEYPEATSKEIKVRALSPIVSYSTMERPDGRKFTYYFEPDESEFARLVIGNLYKKYKAWEPETDISENDFNFSIKPLNGINRRILMYKGTVIKGYSGNYLLEGNQECLNFALNVGLGAKGSQGFGAIELI